MITTEFIHVQVQPMKSSRSLPALPFARFASAMRDRGDGRASYFLMQSQDSKKNLKVCPPSSAPNQATELKQNAMAWQRERGWGWACKVRKVPLESVPCKITCLRLLAEHLPLTGEHVFCTELRLEKLKAKRPVDFFQGMRYWQ